jgi:dynein heavy chain, axonemal
MNREEANQLKVTQLNDRMFRNHLEDCLGFGKPLLIENIEEELDPVLDPVLERRVIRKGKTYVVPLADKEVDFTDTFRLFCTTRLPNPHFTPELSAKVCGVFGCTRPTAWLFWHDGGCPVPLYAAPFVGVCA